MTHIPGIPVPFDEPGPWKATKLECARCKGPVQSRTHVSTCGTWEDKQYRCDTCAHTWWVDGIDS